MVRCIASPLVEPTSREEAYSITGNLKVKMENGKGSVLVSLESERESEVEVRGGRLIPNAFTGARHSELAL